MKQFLFVALITLLSACASKVTVKNSLSENDGIPFQSGVLYVKCGTYTTHTKLKQCKASPFVKQEVLPTGQTYFINVDAAQIAKTGFTVKLNDRGLLSEVTLNTEPSTALVESVTKALTELLPFAGVVPDLPAPEITPGPEVAPEETVDGPACNAGESQVKFVKFDEFTSESCPTKK